MPRSTDKITLLAISQKNFDLLMDFINSRNEADQHKEFLPGTMNRNIRDVLGHLYHWQLMMKSWYDIGMSGKKPDMPAIGYTWKTVPEFNQWIWEQYRNVSLSELISKHKESHINMMDMIQKHTNEELFEKKRYPWTGSTSLGAYFISATSSHYVWALKFIKKAIKEKT